jgi:hypothetical protein
LSEHTPNLPDLKSGMSLAMWSMSGAGPSALQSASQVNPKTEAGGLAADVAAALAIVNHGEDGGLHRFKLGEPSRQSLAWTRCLQGTGGCEGDAHAVALR